MAVTGTITRSRKNDFVEVTDEESEDELKQFVENATSGDHVTIHSGDYTGLPSDGKAIEIPQDVTITILGSANVQVNVSGNSFNYPIFGGATENIIDLNLLNENNFQTQVALSINQVGSLNLESIVVDDSGSNPTFSVNNNDNSKIKFGKLDQDGILYINTSDGEVTTSSDLTYSSSSDIFRVKADQVIEGGLTVQSALSFGSATTSGPLEVNDLDSNRIVTTNSNSELITQDSFKFDGSNFTISDSVDVLYNTSPPGSADIHFNPTDGMIEQKPLTVNQASLQSSRALHVTQGDESVGFYLQGSNSITDMLRVRNIDQTSDILRIQSDRSVLIGNVDADSLSTSDDFVVVDNNGDSNQAGISVNGNYSIRYNSSSSQWEFTNDGSTFLAIPEYDEIVLTETLSGGSRTDIVVENEFNENGLSGQEVSLRVWVKDSTSGNPTSGKWINSEAVATVVRDLDNNNSYDYQVYNEHPDSQDFKFVLRKYR